VRTRFPFGILAAAIAASYYFVSSGLNWNGPDFGMSLRLFLVTLLILKTLQTIIAAVRKTEPWTRALVPLFLAAEVGLVASHQVPRLAGMISLAVLDVALLCFALWTVAQVRNTLSADHPEQALERSFNRFFPAHFSRVAAIELTIVASAFRAFRYVWYNQRYDGCSYTESAKIRLLVLAMPIMLLPDLFFVHFVLPAGWLVAKICLDALGVYACFWVLGLFATMASRPHDLTGPTIVLRRGILNSAELSPSAIERVDVLGPQRGFGKPGLPKDEAHLIVGGVPAVDIVLKEPAVVNGLLSRSPRCVRRIVVASDRPNELASRLVSAAHAICP
jgi:hypothetical protein